MPIEAEGDITPRLEEIRDLLSGLTSWRTWTGTANASAARAKTHLIAALPFRDEAYELADIVALRTCAIINLFPQDGWASLLAGSDGFLDHGRILIQFEANVPTDAPYVDTAMDFFNNYGKTLAELRDAATGGDYPYITAVRTFGRVERCDPRERSSVGDYHFGRAVIDYGLK